MHQFCSKACIISIILNCIVIEAATETSAAVGALLNYTIIDFLIDVKHLHGYENLLIVQNQNATISQNFIRSLQQRSANDTAGDDAAYEQHFIKHIMLDLQLPVLQMNEKASFYLKPKFSELLMSVVYLDGDLFNDNAGLLQKFLASLLRLRQTKILFLLNYAQVDDVLLVQLFEYCWEYKMINVIAIFTDYQKTATFYRYTHFPTFAIEAKHINTDAINRKDLYPYRLGDLLGYKLPYIIGGSDPRIIVYLQPNGKLWMGGFVGHFLQSFAKKYNCQLVEPLPAKINAFAPGQELLAAVRNGTVEISAAITFPQIPFVNYSYPYEQLNWCLMLPVEADIPGYEFYVIVFQWSGWVLTLASIILISAILSTALYQNGHKAHVYYFIIHESVLRGILGQSFIEIAKHTKIVSFIYLQICILGILLTTSYNSYFSTYVTSAPKLPPFRNFDDILYSGLKIFVWAPEYNELLGRTPAYNKYVPMFFIEPDYRKYLQTRDSYNTEYGYVTPTTKWAVFNEQQKFFTIPIFRRREHLCFFNNIPMCFPVQENSLYKQTLYQLMLELAQSGLTEYWHKNGFYEMITAGQMSFADLSKKPEFEAMKVDDLLYIVIGLSIMLVIVIVVFLGELCVYYRHRMYKCLKIIYDRLCGSKRH